MPSEQTEMVANPARIDATREDYFRITDKPGARTIADSFQSVNCRGNQRHIVAELTAAEFHHLFHHSGQRSLERSSNLTHLPARNNPAPCLPTPVLDSAQFVLMAAIRFLSARPKLSHDPGFGLQANRGRGACGIRSLDAKTRVYLSPAPALNNATNRFKQQMSITLFSKVL